MLTVPDWLDLGRAKPARDVDRRCRVAVRLARDHACGAYGLGEMRPASNSHSMRDERPTMFLMVGLPGAGKTVRARELAAARHALLLNPDAWMIPLLGRGFQSPQWRRRPLP